MVEVFSAVMASDRLLNISVSLSLPLSCDKPCQSWTILEMEK